MNDTTVWCQNASVTEPQRDRGTATAVDEAFEKINFAQHGALVGTVSRGVIEPPSEREVARGA